MIDLADDLGWTLEELGKKMSARELVTRLTRRMNKDGYTFSIEKIELIQKQRNKQRVDEFMQRARAHWGKK